MFCGLNFGKKRPLSGAAEDNVALVVDWGCRIVERRSLVCGLPFRVVGDDENTSVFN